ncbi:GTP-binding protein [Bacillus sp. 1P06AnD]|uniref:GTP-binding protein n=1 Tax=Bacillus sp. 1P06AnD TaxID=3132208 RepID=UPI0039A26F9C
MNKTIGILAHVDAGKTTFSEQLLYHTDSIKKRGRVDHKDAFLDCHEIERQRGITVFAEQGIMDYQDSTYYLIDNPGHVDFSPEMERSIQVLDYAIVIVSAVEGIRGHTETVWHLLRKHSIPTFFFLNKTDQAGADAEKVLEEMQRELTDDICNITSSFKEETMSEELAEFIAERDEQLLDRYMDEGYSKEIWLDKMIEMVRECRIFPACSGSALKDIGVVEFLEKFNALTKTSYSKADPFSARVYKIRHDEKGTRLTFIKILGGTVNVRDEIQYGDCTEKITGLRKYNGHSFEQVKSAGAGELVALIGLSAAAVGKGLGGLQEQLRYELVPALKSKVNIHSSIHIKDALRSFYILNDEDPSLHVTWDETVQEIHIHVMGVMQLEILKQIIPDRFHFDVSFEEPTIVYKETIEKEVYGYGHFEPLGHYAEVHLQLEPGERDSGIVFENVCHANDLSAGNQNLIRKHLLEKEHRGILTGSAVTDLKITLLTGRAHVKHTSGGDFKEAAYRAFRQGLEQASNILLEPFYDFKIKVELDQIGRVMADIQAAHGSFNPPQTEGNRAVLAGKAPVATFMKYSSELASFTQGTGVIQLVFGGYGPCHNPEEVKVRIGYDKNSDPEYQSSSIFCSKGQAYTVPWDQAKEEMHAL